MDDFCDCSQCPHHCGGDEEEIVEDDSTATAPADDTANSEEDSVEASIEASTTKSSSDAEALAGKKVDSLKKDILDLGFKLEETGDGIRVTM
ncbi:MAG: hypothetical protein WC848_00090 [Parcubacteria group bacterium]|jgi:hypothetical protein